ncbi:MAG TPA: hypothetical protein PLR83_07680 [Pyrinomonadaceae bacterium]|nr:hypothetical protein [Pyrinomonadaceae bacterium]
MALTDLIPIIPILALAGLSIFVKSIVGFRVRNLLGASLIVYFLALFFIASENRYPFLFGAIISSLFIFKSFRPAPSNHHAR